MGKTSAHSAAQNKLVSLESASLYRILCGFFVRLVLLPYFSKVNFPKMRSCCLDTPTAPQQPLRYCGVKGKNHFMFFEAFSSPLGIECC